MRVGARPMKPPEQKPKRTAKAMMTPVVLPGIHSASEMTAERPVMKIMTLKRPMRSPTMPGRIRPRTLRERNRTHLSASEGPEWGWGRGGWNEYASVCLPSSLRGWEISDRSSYSPNGIDDGQQIRRQSGIHAGLLGLQDDVGEGQEHAPEEQEASEDGQHVGRLAEAAKVLADDEGPGPGRDARPHRQAGDAEQEEEQEGDGADGPGEADLGDHLVHHDGEDDAAHGGARHQDA